MVKTLPSNRIIQEMCKILILVNQLYKSHQKATTDVGQA